MDQTKEEIAKIYCFLLELDGEQLSYLENIVCEGQPERMSKEIVHSFFISVKRKRSQ